VVEKAQAAEIVATISRIAFRSPEGCIAVTINAEGYASASGDFEGGATLERGMRCRFRGIPSTFNGKPTLDLIGATILERDLHDPKWRPNTPSQARVLQGRRMYIMDYMNETCARS
jgi:hypothetical protein